MRLELMDGVMRLSASTVEEGLEMARWPEVVVLTRNGLDSDGATIYEAKGVAAVGRE